MYNAQCATKTDVHISGELSLAMAVVGLRRARFCWYVACIHAFSYLHTCVHVFISFHLALSSERPVVHAVDMFNMSALFLISASTARFGTCMSHTLTLTHTRTPTRTHVASASQHQAPHLANLTRIDPIKIPFPFFSSSFLHPGVPAVCSQALYMLISHRAVRVWYPKVASPPPRCMSACLHIASYALHTAYSCSCSCMFVSIHSTRRVAAHLVQHRCSRLCFFFPLCLYGLFCLIQR